MDNKIEYWSDYIDKPTRTVNIHLEAFDTMIRWNRNNKLKKSHDRVIVFGYWWLINYLWKYAKYGQYEIGVKDIKNMLHISTSTKVYDYIFKKDGLLDNEKWTDYETNYPIAYRYDGNIEYKMLNDLDEFTKDGFKKSRNRNYFVKKPIAAYVRFSKQGRSEIVKDGTLWSKDDVFTLSVKEFRLCTENKVLGLLGFYLYAYIKLQYKLFGKRVVGITYDQFEKVTGYKERKIREVLFELENIGLIKIIRNTTRRDDKIKTWNDYKIVNYTD